MSKVQQPDLLQDPPADWLEANGFILQGLPCMKEDARLALRAMYQTDLDRQAARVADPRCDRTELIDAPFPEVLTDIVPDYSKLPEGVEPGSPEEARMNEFLERHYGYNDTSNPEIAA